MSLKPYLDHPIVQMPLSIVRLPGYILRRPPLLIVLILILILVGGYGAGYRIGPGVSLVKIGTVVLSHIPVGASVYVNEALHKTAKETGMRIPLLPGTHSILIGTEDYYPWNELVTVPAGKELPVRPIFIAKSAKETMLRDLDRERGELTIQGVVLPTKEAPIRVFGNCASVFMQNGDLIIEPVTTDGCTPPDFLCLGGCEPALLLDPSEALRAVIPFPGRDDAVIIALGKAIYALEVDPREPQFFAPILREHLPKVGPWSENAIVVEEFGAVFTISFP